MRVVTHACGKVRHVMHFWEWNELGNNPEGGLVRVKHPDGGWTAVLLPTDGSPRKLVELITGPDLNLLPHDKIVGAIVRGSEDASVVAPSVGCEAAPYYHEIVYPAGSPTKISSWRRKGSSSQYEFTGGLLDYVKYAAGKILPETVVGKVVRFYYNGGTHEGWRTVKIESLTDTHVKGVDCEKMEPRCYRIDVIGSDLVVLA